MDSPLPPRSPSHDHLPATSTDDDNNNRVECPACPEIFSSYQQFNIHFDDVHLSSEEKLEMARRSRRPAIREDSMSPFADGTPAFTNHSNLAVSVEGRVSPDERHQEPWGCTLCTKSFTRYYTLKEHVKDVHNGPPPRLAACQFRGCRFTFTVKGNYEEHWWNNHRSQGQSVPAPRASMPVATPLPAAQSRHSSHLRGMGAYSGYGGPRDLKCPHDGCNFVHWQEDAVREHWQSTHATTFSDFPGSVSLRNLNNGTSNDATMDSTPASRASGAVASASSFQQSPETPSFTFKPSHERDYLATQKNSTATPTRPTMSSAARRAQSQRPMGARAFAKLALFEQNGPDGDLKPIPRPLPSRNRRWSSGEEFSDDDKILDSDSDSEPESSEDDSPKQPPKRLRFAAANAIGSGPYNNPDESDSDMSDGRSPTPEPSENANGAAPVVNSGPVVLPPSHTSGVPYRRGYVYPGLDFDNIMTFPPDPSLVDPNVRRPRVAIPKPKKSEMKEVPMSFTDDAETPHMSFVMRRAQALAEAEQEARHPGYAAKATAKKVRRRTDNYAARPKRAYNWKTENKNKKKRYEENGFMGRAADREKALEKALAAEQQAKEAAKEFRRLEKLSRLNTNGKRDREASKEEDDE